MRNITLFFAFIVMSNFSFGQSETSDFSLGAGYYGERITHPGFYLQSEYLGVNKKNKFRLPIRGGFGYYFHKRRQQAIFMEVAPSIRYYMKNGLSIGLGGGVGLMMSWYHSDLGVYSVDHNNIVTKESNYAGVDFIPSVHLDVCYNIITSEKYKHYVWLRPSTFFQLPENDGYIFHYSLAIGYSIQFLKSDK